MRADGIPIAAFHGLGDTPEVCAELEPPPSERAAGSIVARHFPLAGAV